MIWNQANNLFDEHGNEQDLGVNGFKPMLATWDQHPDRDATWATEERGRIGEERFRREHECEFIIYDETLIDPLKLVEMTGVEPKNRMGQVRWYKQPSPENIYLVTLDPSSGTGGDYSAIQVIEVPSMIQVAEWQHNKSPVEKQIKVMMEIMHYIKEQTMSLSEIYWTVENNAIGEAALVVIRDTGEESFPGDFLHEPKRIQGKKGRKGYHTTHKNKMEACLQLKRLIESNKITLNSKALVSELKSFVSSGNSFKAKPGATDDLVMALVIAIRMVEYISGFEDDVYNAVNSSLSVNPNDPDGMDDMDYPMPIGLL